MFDNIDLMKLFQLNKVQPEDKAGSVELVHTIIELAFKAKREGILSIEADVSDDKEKPFSQLMRMMLKGFNLKIIDDITQLKLLSSLDNSSRFNLFIAWLGIHLMYVSANTGLIAMYLIEAFGTDSNLLGDIHTFQIEVVSKGIAECDRKMEYVLNELDAQTFIK